MSRRPNSSRPSGAISVDGKDDTIGVIASRSGSVGTVPYGAARAGVNLVGRSDLAWVLASVTVDACTAVGTRILVALTVSSGNGVIRIEASNLDGFRTASVECVGGDVLARVVTSGIAQIGVLVVLLRAFGVGRNDTGRGSFAVETSARCCSFAVVRARSVAQTTDVSLVTAAIQSLLETEGAAIGHQFAGLARTSCGSSVFCGTALNASRTVVISSARAFSRRVTVLVVHLAVVIYTTFRTSATGSSAVTGRTRQPTLSSVIFSSVGAFCGGVRFYRVFATICSSASFLTRAMSGSGEAVGTALKTSGTEQVSTERTRIGG